MRHKLLKRVNFSQQPRFAIVLLREIREDNVQKDKSNKIT